MVERVSIGTATNKYKLTERNAWTIVGPGPLLLMASNPILYAFSDEIPEGEEGFVLQRGEMMHIPLAKTVWVASRGDTADVLVGGPDAPV